jgi:hypothetical protein
MTFCLQSADAALLSRPLPGVGCLAAVDFVNRVIATLGAKSPGRNGDGKTQVDWRSHPVNRATNSAKGAD